MTKAVMNWTTKNKYQILLKGFFRTLKCPLFSETQYFPPLPDISVNSARNQTQFIKNPAKIIELLINIVSLCNGGYNFLRHHSYPGP